MERSYSHNRQVFDVVLVKSFTKSYYPRAMVVNAAQLASYSQAKQAILDTGYIQVSYSEVVFEATLLIFIYC